MSEKVIFNLDGYGTLADWIGIVATVLTIFLTIRYYLNDNKRDFRIVFYPIYYSESNGIQTFYSEPVSFEFYAVNFSKQTDAVYFYTIRNSGNYFKRKILGISIYNINWDFNFGERRPEYQNVEPKHSTKKEVFKAHWFMDHALYVYNKSKYKKFIKKIKLEIVYVNVEGKEFSKKIVITVDELIRYKNEKEKNRKAARETNGKMPQVKEN
ncbi:hypothetical protein ORY94_09920 [Enterococcus casseliflavus]|uniref:hypothetical protein n=1 Tax=Enterococcus casseliflavus TaxID=37734 RepID=UPI00225BB265|nr:hypothetical protein [Enterococcus casseliflavus]MCX4168238.1 hypothetical protein [Enterococcus casseliflavus]